MSDPTTLDCANDNRSILAAAHNDLLAPFDASDLAFLPRGSANGRALALAHVDARAVMGRLDSTVGPENWSFDYEVKSADCKRVKGILTVAGVTKCDAGEAGAEEEPLKAAVSDALKRCAVHFGVGRYLYYLPPMWAPFDAAKRRFTDMPSIAPQPLRSALAAVGWKGVAEAPPAPKPNGASARATQAVKNGETSSYGAHHGLEPTLKDEMQRARDNAAALGVKGDHFRAACAEALNVHTDAVKPQEMTTAQWNTCANFLQEMIDGIAGKAAETRKAMEEKALAEQAALATAWSEVVGVPVEETAAEALVGLATEGQITVAPLPDPSRPAEGSIAAQIVKQSKHPRKKSMPAPGVDPFTNQ